MHNIGEERLTQLDKILHARTFQGSESLRSFLQFVVKHAIENEESRLKEYIIATEVFGRGNDFDPRIDSVVRVQAGRLRAKLQEYYSTEGKDDQILIELPKGHYTPTFNVANLESINGISAESKDANNVQTVRQEPGSHSNTTEQGKETKNWKIYHSEDSIQTRQKKTRLLAIGALFSALLMSVLLIAYNLIFDKSQAAGVKGQLANTTSISPKNLEPVWGAFLRSPEPVLIAYSNTLFQGTAERGMKLLKSLDSPGSSLGSPVIPQSEIEKSTGPIIEHYTGIGEVMAGYSLGKFFAELNHSSRMKRSLLLTWEDLKTENIIVIGSPAENLFLRDIPQKQEILFKPNLPNREGGEEKAFGIEILNPKKGEQKYYFAAQGGPSRSQISEDYAVISLLPGLNGHNRLMILAGITTLGTQAAAEYVVKPEYVNDLVKRMNIASMGNSPKLPASYQVLIKVRVNGGVPIQFSYVTHHVLQ